MAVDDTAPRHGPVALADLFNPALTLLLAELDSWPEKQGHHHYDGLCALHILWMIASTRGAYAGGSGFQSIPRRSYGSDDDLGGGSRRMM